MPRLTSSTSLSGYLEHLFKFPVLTVIFSKRPSLTQETVVSQFPKLLIKQLRGDLKITVVFLR
jgi:hypothetical protein